MKIDDDVIGSVIHDHLKSSTPWTDLPDETKLELFMQVREVIHDINLPTGRTLTVLKLAYEAYRRQYLREKHDTFFSDLKEG